MFWHGSNLVAMALCAATLSSPWTFAQTRPPCAADLKIGQTISCSIDEPGHERTHRFTASVTDSIRIDVQSPVITPHLESCARTAASNAARDGANSPAPPWMSPERIRFW